MTSFDPWDPAHLPDPHALYRRMRTEAPVWRGIGPVTGRPIWFLTRYDDCVAALRDHRLGKDFAAHLDPDQVEAEQALEARPLEPLGRNMLFVDPPDHTRLRRLVAKEFTPRAIAGLEERVTKLASSLLDDLAGRDRIDLIADFAHPLPVTVISEMLGIPIEDRERFRRWVDIVLRGPIGSDQQTLAGMEFIAYLNEAIESRRRAPRDDLLTALIHAEEEGDRLDHTELLAMVFLLLVAGHETTVNLIGNGTLALLRNRAEMARLRSTPSLMPAAVEELLRYEGPVGVATNRWAFDDVEYGGVTIPRGELVIPVLLAANRDPDVFPEPDRLDLGRDPNRHIAFGSGIHLCLGAPLARLEGAIAFSALLDRYAEIEPAVPLGDLEWNEDFFLRGVRSLPLEVA
jgi:cytochrome P450